MSGMSVARRTAGLPHALEAKRLGSNERYFDDKGNLNASSTKDAIMALAALVSDAQQGRVNLSPVRRGVETAEALADRMELRAALLEAYNDRTGHKWAEHGMAIAAEVTELSNREGFLRGLLLKGETTAGSPVRITVKQKNVTAISASSASEMRATYVRDKYILPPEFWVKASIRVDQRELVQGSGNQLEDAFFNAQEQIMIEEDRILKRLLDGTVNLLNSQQALVGGLTPTSLAATRNEVIKWGINTPTMLMATDLWNDIIGNAAAFGNLFDPVTQFELIQTGYLGTLLGMQVISDAYRAPELKVLNAGEMYLLGPQEQLGTYTDRGPVESEPVNEFQLGNPSRGWFFYELMSITVHNPRAVVKAIRS